MVKTLGRHELRKRTLRAIDGIRGVSRNTLVEIIRTLHESQLDVNDVTASTLNSARHDPDQELMTELFVPSWDGPDLRIPVADMRLQLQRTCANSQRFCSILERALRRCPNGPTQK